MSNVPDYLEALKAAILKTSKFQFVSGSGDVRDISLQADGRIDDPKGEVASWSIAEDRGRSVFVMTLMVLDRTPYSILTIQRDGVWKGRDRKTRGTIMLRPYPLEGAQEEWRTLADPSAYFRSLKPDARKPDFHYLEPLPRQKDWTKEENWKITQEIEVSSLPQQEEGQKEAGLIIGWNRLDYFRKVVQSIAQNPESQTLPWFLFLDYYQDTSLTKKQADLAKSLFPHLVIVKRDRTYGCGRNIIDARRQLFDYLGFDYVWVFEDDLVVAPNYMQFCRNLMRWGEENFDNCGAVQGWIKCRESLDWKKRKLHVVQSTYDNWWAYLMSKKAWDGFKDFVYSYQSLFLGGEYHARPHNTIVDWFHKYRKDPPAVVGTRHIPDNGDALRTRRSYFGAPPSGQDAATMIGFHQAGWRRLTPLVNRAQYIGMNGIHMHSGYWERMKYGEVSLDVFEGDSSLSGFVLAR